MLRQGVARCGALVRQHIDGVTRASAGTKSGSSAHSLVLHTMLAPVSTTARLGTSATARRRIELGNRRSLPYNYTGSLARHVVAVGDLPTSSASAPQLCWSPNIWVLRPDAAPPVLEGLKLPQPPNQRCSTLFRTGRNLPILYRLPYYRATQPEGEHGSLRHAS